MRREKEENMKTSELSNQDLFESYKGQRGDIASEMCRRAGTIEYLLRYCTDDDRSFYSCMRDTIEVFKSHLLTGDRKYAKY